jgi:hypothetical protein
MPTMVLLEPRGLQLYLVVRGGIGFIRVLEAVISFWHTFRSDTLPRSLAQARLVNRLVAYQLTFTAWSVPGAA